MPSIIESGRNRLGLNQLSEDPRGIIKEHELLWMLGGFKLLKAIPQPVL